MAAAHTVLAGRYELRELLARGGMADVHRGFDRTLEREVAIKILRGEVGEARRFQGEIRMLVSFDHPNLVKLLDAGEHDGLPFLVLALVDGPTLARRLDEVGVLAPSDTAAVARDVAAALAHVHAARVVHRDVKPSNILLAGDGRALLGDFGVARLLESTSVTQTGFVVGTARYLSPEQAAGEHVDTASDVYSLGIVLLEALTGTPAFQGSPAEVAVARLHRAPAIPEDLLAPWPELLRAMTARDPAARPDAADVVTTLDHARSAATTGSDATTPMTLTAVPLRSQEHPLRRRPFDQPWPWALAAAMVLLVIGVLVAVAISRRTADGITTTTIAMTTSPPTVASTAPPAVEATSPVAVAPPTDAPPATADHAAICAQIENEKQAIEAQKQRIEEQYKDDKDTREQRKEELEAQKKDVEQRKQQAGC